MRRRARGMATVKGDRRHHYHQHVHPPFRATQDERSRERLPPSSRPPAQLAPFPPALAPPPHTSISHHHYPHRRHPTRPFPPPSRPCFLPLTTTTAHRAERASCSWLWRGRGRVALGYGRAARSRGGGGGDDGRSRVGLRVPWSSSRKYTARILIRARTIGSWV